MDPERKEEKKPYEKPRLRTIELATEEVLGTGCKGDTTFGPDGPPSTCTAGAGCVDFGS